MLSPNPPSLSSSSDMESSSDSDGTPFYPDDAQDNTMRNRFLLGLLALLIVGSLVGLIIWLVNITSDDDSSGGDPSNENKVHGCTFVKWTSLNTGGGTLNSGGRDGINHVNIDKQLYSWDLANGDLKPDNNNSMPNVSDDPDEIITYQTSLIGKNIEIIPTLSRIPGDIVDYRNNESAFNIPLPPTNSENILTPSVFRPKVYRGYALGEQRNAFWVSYQDDVNMCNDGPNNANSKTPDVLILVDEKLNQKASHSFDMSKIEQVEIRSWVIGGRPSMAFIQTPPNGNTQLFVGIDDQGVPQEVKLESAAHFQYVSNWSATGGEAAYIYASDNNNNIYAIDSGQRNTTMMPTINFEANEKIVGLQVFNNGNSLLITTATGLRIVDVAGDNGGNKAIQIDEVISRAEVDNNDAIVSARAVALPSNKMGLVYLTENGMSRYSVLSCTE
jgi:hypothetical protein